MFFWLKAKIQVMRQTGSKQLGNDVQGCTACSTTDKSVSHRSGGKKEVVDQALTVETKLECREHVGVSLWTGFVEHDQV